MCNEVIIVNNLIKVLRVRFFSSEECIPASSCQQYIEDNERLGSFDNQSDEYQEISSELDDQICEQAYIGREEKVCCKKKKVRNFSNLIPTSELLYDSSSKSEVAPKLGSTLLEEAIPGWLD